MKLKRQWLKDCNTEEDKDKRIERIQSARYIFSVLTDILTERLDDSYKQQESKTNYDSPAWSEQQADFIGSQREIRKLIELITFEE